MKGESTWPVTTSFPRRTSPTVWHYLSKASSVFRHTFNQTPIPSVTLLEDQSSAGGLQDTQFYHHFPNMKRTITRIRVGEREGQKGKRWKQFFQIGLRQDLGYTISFFGLKTLWKKENPSFVLWAFRRNFLNHSVSQEQESVPWSWVTPAEMAAECHWAGAVGGTHFDSQSQER